MYFYKSVYNATETFFCYLVINQRWSGLDCFLLWSSLEPQQNIWPPHQLQQIFGKVWIFYINSKQITVFLIASLGAIITHWCSSQRTTGTTPRTCRGRFPSKTQNQWYFQDILWHLFLKFTYHPIIDFTEEDVEAVLNMVFCACDEGSRDGVLSLDEFTSEVCEVCKTFLNFM